MAGRITRVAAATLLVVGAGCVDWAETLEFNADGSGTLVMTMVIPKAGLGPQYIRVGELPTLESIKTGLPEGVTCQEFDRHSEMNAWKNPTSGEEQELEFEHFRVKLAFTDANLLNRVRFFPEPPSTDAVPTDAVMSASGIMTPVTRRPGPFQDVTVKLKKGTLTFRRVIQKAQTTKRQEMHLQGSNMGLALETLKNHAIELTVRCPGEVTSSNATRAEGRELTWIFPLLRLMEEQDRDHTVEFSCKLASQ